MNTWQSVRAEVLSRIKSGEWAPGTLIPTEHELAEELGCARATVNRALRDLADSGIVERRRKVGTRVSTMPSHRSTVELSVIRHEIEAMGGSYRYALLKLDQVAAPAVVASALQMRAGEPVLAVRTQHFANDKPHCSEIVWLNPAVLPPVQRRDLEETPPLEWLSRNATLTQGRSCILAESASGDCARALEVRAGTPVLVIERNCWAGFVPVAFARQFYLPGFRLITED